MFNIVFSHAHDYARGILRCSGKYRASEKNHEALNGVARRVEQKGLQGRLVSASPDSGDCTREVACGVSSPSVKLGVGAFDPAYHFPSAVRMVGHSYHRLVADRFVRSYLH